MASYSASLTGFAQVSSIAKPECQEKCGNVNITYPFGIGNNCSFDWKIEIICNTTFDPPKPFLLYSNLEVLNISVLQGTIQVMNPVFKDCTTEIQTQEVVFVYNPFTFSATQNIFAAIGCNNLALIKTRSESNLGDKNWFRNLDDIYSVQNMGQVPAVLDWTLVGSCLNTSFCGNNTICTNETKLCSCKPGYEGNPFLPDGCHAVGHYTCISDEDDVNKASIVFEIATCAGLGVLLVLAATWWLCKVVKRRKIRKLKEKNFERNGGLLLHLQLSSSEGHVDATLFTSKALEMATDRYSKDRILGQGGQGTVYKGMLTDGRIVAVKKSKIEDESKKEQFINEVVLLSKINHRNIVKLHGYCLETEVPLLVYEFIPNGTLYEYIHDHSEDSPLTWDIRVRVSIEIAGALFYLHSAASIPIFHRDIKSSNILLEEKYRAKLVDFGTSKSIAIDQTHLTTRVQVLVELLRGLKPILAPRAHDEGRSLATHFILTMEENRIFDILDPRIGKEDRKEEITAFANIAYRCLNLNGRKRPTMKQVAAELEGINLSNRLPNAEHYYEEIDYPVNQLNGLWDLTSTSLSSSTSNSVKVGIEPLIRKY
ncbi:Protein kinase domain-containing protein [Heracleum sosnowskyi]|uniref:Protein kinase domain-containing protein n=1 Tax=Heracleum sosnowskyi TaxID=360622 RepID=A0AAD8N9E2_9APIA|nr:Protein kinase domain-containing protein [Heracleum sosnowskyi]